MSRTKEQKIKLLVLFDILCKQTDEDHALTTRQIIELMQEKGIDVSCKVLPDDIALLNEFGYEVLTKKDHLNGYYVVDHTFEPAEITMFSDAVQASKLTEGHKARLIHKLSETVGEHQAESIEQNLVFCDMRSGAIAISCIILTSFQKQLPKRKMCHSGITLSTRISRNHIEKTENGISPIRL